jgi:predicted transcriptional regulator
MTWADKYRVLIVLYKASEELTIEEIEKKINEKYGKAGKYKVSSKLLDFLIQHNLIERFGTDPFTYEITSQGHEIISKYADGEFKLSVVANRFDSENDDIGENGEPLEVGISIKDEKDGPMLIISIQDEDTIDYPLVELYEEALIIDRIPAALFTGDPFTGCLIRSGLSATIGQIIDCKNQTAGFEWYLNRTREIGKCLYSDLPDMTSKMAFRATKCIMTLGIGG